MENQRPAPPSDEIDLGQLFSKIGDFFKSMAMGFVRFIALLRRIPLENRASFLVIIIASGAIGFGYSALLKKNYYESTMILSSNYLNKRLVENSIDKLNTLAGEPDKKGLAKTLGIPDSVAKNIIAFSATPFVSESDLIELEVLKEQLKSAQVAAKNDKVIDQVIRRIEIENRHAFEITIRTLTPRVVGNLQGSLVNYFRDNEYIKKRIEINHASLREREVKLEGDVRKLDSLKQVIYANYRAMAEQSRQGSNNVILSDKSVVSPTDIYTQDMDVYNQFQAVKSELYLRPDFEIVDGFTEFSEPASISRPKMIIYSLLVGIIIAYIDVALRALNRYLANVK